MRIYFHADGSQTIARPVGRLTRQDVAADTALELSAVRILEISELGAVRLVKDRWSGPSDLLGPVPLSRVHV